MKPIKFIKYSAIFALAGLTACTNLDEQVLDEQLGADLVNNPNNVEALINPPYASLRRTIEWYDFWALQEVSTDEVIIPARGTDWYDNGDWQQLHRQTWTANHPRMKNVWEVLNQGVSRANTAIYYIGQFPQNATTTQYINEAKFLRIYYLYMINDLFGQIPVREPNEVDFSVSPKVLKRLDAADYMINELKAIIPNLKTKAQVGSDKATVGAAKALLAKIYMNYGVYSGNTITKWDEAITMCNEIIASPDYSITSDYWTMFRKDVAEHDEFILRVPMDDNVDMGSGSVWVNFTLHYSQVFGSITSTWNGPSVTSTFYNTFDVVNDARVKDDRIKSECGFNLGFLVGQQYSINGEALKQRNGEPLVFVPEINLESSPENAGIRCIKYEPNAQTTRQFSSPNDVPVIRISDIYLLRAEAKMRKGDAAGAMNDVNAIRAKRSAAGKSLPALTSITLDDILNERGFELYWEGHRRNDLIRFGKFDDAWQEKSATAINKAVYPLPTSATDVNENLIQNEGY